MVPVQLQRLAPYRAGLLVLAEGGVRMTQPAETVGHLAGVADVAVQGEGLLVVVNGLLVVAGVVDDVAQAVPGGRLAVGIVVAAEQDERGLAPGLRFADPRVQALLHTLLVFRLQLHGFTNRNLRHAAGELLGPAQAMTTTQATYDLRRLRHHGLIERIPHTHRYRVTPTGLRSALFLTHTHDRLLRTGLAQITGTQPTRLRAAADAYDKALDRLTHEAGLAA